MDNKLLLMNVVKSAHHLLKQILGVVFLEFSSLSHVTQQVTSLTKFHNKAHVLASFERIIKLNNILVGTLL